MKKQPIEKSDSDLLPLADPQLVGLPFKRRRLGMLVAENKIAVHRVNGRLYITRADLEAFKRALIEKHRFTDGSGFLTEASDARHGGA